jgi:phosphate-selective porin OprO/OprP
MVTGAANRVDYQLNLSAPQSAPTGNPGFVAVPNGQNVAPFPVEGANKNTGETRPADKAATGPKEAATKSTDTKGEDKSKAAAKPAEKKDEKPKFPTTTVSGVFQLDWGFFSQDAASQATLGDIQDGSGFRRARLAAKGNVAENTSYLFEFDFALTATRFIDVWVQQAKTPLGNIRVGRFRQPFGLAELTSVRDLPFLERPLTFALGPFRQTGISLSQVAPDERTTFAISGYRFLNDAFGNVYADNGGYGTAMRLTSIPIDLGGNYLFHLGGGYSFNDPGRDLLPSVSADEVSFGQNPLLGLPGLSVDTIDAVPPFVSTGAIPTKNNNDFNIELAIAGGRSAIESEVRWAHVNQLNGISNVFPAAYVQYRYVLTGEEIPYDRQSGFFKRIVPDPCSCGFGLPGAWEIATRASYIDLNGDGIPGPGRRLTDVTVGLNWYVNGFTKCQLNWIHAQLDDQRIGDSTTQTVAFRTQLDF